MARQNRLLEKNFENLKVLRTRMFRPARGPSRRRCLCLCNCGRKFFTWAHQLMDENTTSCGCARASRLKTPHRAYAEGYSNPTHPLFREYRRWGGMIARCYASSNHAYSRYGGRGIKVCTRWHNFENFLADMGVPATGLTLDRINNDGDYEPGNCRWATRKEQANNRVDNVSLEERWRRGKRAWEIKRLNRILRAWE